MFSFKGCSPPLFVQVATTGSAFIKSTIISIKGLRGCFMSQTGASFYSTISLLLAFVQARAVPPAPGGAPSTAGLPAAGSAPSPAAPRLPSSSAVLFAPQALILRVKVSPGSVKRTLAPATRYKGTPPAPAAPPAPGALLLPLPAPHRLPKPSAPRLAEPAPLPAQRWGPAAIQRLLRAARGGLSPPGTGAAFARR